MLAWSARPGAGKFPAVSRNAASTMLDRWRGQHRGQDGEMMAICFILARRSALAVP
jgi:hypothetical protein